MMNKILSYYRLFLVVCPFIVYIGHFVYFFFTLKTFLAIVVGISVLTLAFLFKRFSNMARYKIAKIELVTNKDFIKCAFFTIINSISLALIYLVIFSLYTWCQSPCWDAMQLFKDIYVAINNTLWWFYILGFIQLIGLCLFGIEIVKHKDLDFHFKALINWVGLICSVIFIYIFYFVGYYHCIKLLCFLR